MAARGSLVAPKDHLCTLGDLWPPKIRFLVMEKGLKIRANGNSDVI